MGWTMILRRSRTRKRVEANKLRTNLQVKLLLRRVAAAAWSVGREQTRCSRADQR
jgi:hypothetical protein